MLITGLDPTLRGCSHSRLLMVPVREKQSQFTMSLPLSSKGSGLAT